MSRSPLDTDDGQAHNANMTTTWTWKDHETGLTVSFVCGYRGQSFYRIGRAPIFTEFATRGIVEAAEAPEITDPWDGQERITDDIRSAWVRYCAMRRTELVRWFEQRSYELPDYLQAVAVS